MSNTKTSREFEHLAEIICDHCGKYGAYDCYGDHICGSCLDKITEPDEDEVEN